MELLMRNSKILEAIIHPETWILADSFYWQVLQKSDSN